ncbi:MAG: YraN family protein [Deferribacteraceae bacterium]|nr:YraN family protein [Deferribacteraceae bacterium]
MFRLFFGKAGEKLAADYLKKKGYKIICCNYRSFAGEVDIIAEIDNILVFIEVKRRVGELFGKGYEAVRGLKKRRIIRTAQVYLNTLSSTPPCRFDVISIDDGAITHIENAFTA